MWLFQEVDPFSPTGTEPGGFNFAVKFEESIKSAFDPKRIEKFFLKLEDDAKSLNTKIANGLQSNLKNIESTIFEVYKEGLDYGFAYEDAGKFISTVGVAAEKLININKDNVIQALKLSKAMGLSAEEVGKLYGNIMKMGMGQQKANEILEKTFKSARAYGVDASKLSETVTGSILKAQAYGFKDGIEGLTKMAIQAQRVGINMDEAAKAADKAFSPEGAIEMASNLQMLGGNMGGLTDFHSLMYMAQSDTGALQDQILKTTSSMVDFNSKTGEFKISPEMRRNMTQYAESIGSTYDKVAEGAIKFKKEQEIMSRLPMSAGFSEEDKSIISAIGELGKDELGNVTVQIQDPETGKMVDATTLNSTTLKDLKDKYDEANKSVEQVAKEQLSVQDKMAKTLEEIRNAGIFGTGLNRGLQMTDAIDQKLITAAQGFGTQLTTAISNSTLPPTLIDGYKTSLQTLNAVIEEFNNNINDIISNAEKKIDDMSKERTEKSNRMIPEKTKDKSSPPPPTPTPTPTPTPYIPSFLNTDQSSNMNKTLNSTDLNIQKDVLSSSVEKLIPLPMRELSKSEPIERYVENKIINEVNIGGKTELEITLKTPDNNSEKILSLLLNNPELKETVMATINERLSKEYSDKLINVLPG